MKKSESTAKMNLTHKAEENEDNVHAQRRQNAKAEKERLITEQWEVTKHRVTWRVIRESTPDQDLQEYEKLGVRNVDFDKFQELRTAPKHSVEDKKKNKVRTPLNYLNSLQ